MKELEYKREVSQLRQRCNDSELLLLKISDTMDLGRLSLDIQVELARRCDEIKQQRYGDELPYKPWDDPVWNSIAANALARP